MSSASTPLRQAEPTTDPNQHLAELRASIQETADGKKLQISEADIKKFNDTAKSAAAMVRCKFKARPPTAERDCCRRRR